MTRRNALLRLHQHLLACREAAGKKLAGELAYLHACKAVDATGDSADLAFEAGADELSSRLAELDDRELSQIERALARWQQGVYGICDGGSWNCQKKIPVGRLKALPYTPFCINCEREMEKHLDGPGRQSTRNWGRIPDAEEGIQDQRTTLLELERSYG
jgi:RNA polymerase-binding transcription factor DksA